MPDGAARERERLIDWLLGAPEQDVVSLEEVHIEEPEPARITDSVACESCGEIAMVSRTRDVEGRVLCIPCAENVAAG
jgi:formylmethanofuran dehydrogenase subunit E